MDTAKLEAIKKFGLTVAQGKTNPSRPGKQPKDVWEITGVNMRKYEHVLRDEMGLKMWRGKFTSWEDPTDELLERLTESQALSVGEIHDYAAQRSLNRSERIADRADNHASVANDLFSSARAQIAMIPLGQPILVGHHSEKRHRAALAKHDRKMRKAINESDYAKELETRAKGAERNARMRSAETCTLDYAGNRLKEARAERNRCIKELTLRPLCKVIYQGDKDQYNGMKAEVLAIQGDKLVLCFLEPDDHPISEQWEWPKIVATMDQIEWKLPEDYKLRLEIRKANAEEAIEFWNQVVKEKGGDRFSSETIKKGDYVWYWHKWREVVRVNKKSVSVKGDYSWTEKVEYTAMTKHLTAEEYQAKFATVEA